MALSSLLKRAATAAIVAVLLAAAPGRGEAQESSSPSVWSYSFYKTLTYEFFANGSDLLLYSTLLGGTAASSVPFMAVNILSAGSAYYLHELAWNILGPVPETTTGAVELGLTKTLTYRVVSTSRNLVLAYAFTGSPWTAVGYAVVNNVTDTVIYIANEYAWNVYGPPKPPAIVSPPGVPPPR